MFVAIFLKFPHYKAFWRFGTFFSKKVPRRGEALQNLGKRLPRMKHKKDTQEGVFFAFCFLFATDHHNDVVFRQIELVAPELIGDSLGFFLDDQIEGVLFDFILTFLSLGS